MTVEELNATFEKHEEEFLKFERVEKKRSKRPDLHAFLLLDELCPSTDGYNGPCDMVSAAEHDEIWVRVGREDVAGKITEAQIIELVRCGLRLDDFGDGFCLYV